ncbi:MAG: nicotinate-nucleotide diphosphorylase (carboxylating), partial [Elusimicrobiaceae bacterium]|nr:nicotinate-nucleotide diphosphorylase (carboxylating) [Elusimicrobiaceae bacterium]
NMAPKEVEKMVAFVEGRAILEASGGINQSNLEAYAKTGVDVISMGCLTHSVKSADISLLI